MNVENSLNNFNIFKINKIMKIWLIVILNKKIKILKILSIIFLMRFFVFSLSIFKFLKQFFDIFEISFKKSSIVMIFSFQSFHSELRKRSASTFSIDIYHAFNDDFLNFVKISIIVIVNFNWIWFYFLFFIWVVFSECWFQMNHQYDEMNFLCFWYLQFINQTIHFFQNIDRFQTLFTVFMIFQIELKIFSTKLDIYLLICFQINRLVFEIITNFEHDLRINYDIFRFFFNMTRFFSTMIFDMSFSILVLTTSLFSRSVIFRILNSYKISFENIFVETFVELFMTIWIDESNVMKSITSFFMKEYLSAIFTIWLIRFDCSFVWKW